MIILTALSLVVVTRVIVIVMRIMITIMKIIVSVRVVMMVMGGVDDRFSNHTLRCSTDCRAGATPSSPKSEDACQAREAKAHAKDAYTPAETYLDAVYVDSIRSNEGAQIAGSSTVFARSKRARTVETEVTIPIPCSSIQKRLFFLERG